MARKIAIDGPAGAGKSSIARMAAEKLGFVYIDTGAMYRAIGLGAVRRGVDTASREKVEGILDDLTVTIRHRDGAQRIYLNGEDVSQEIRLPEISVAASQVAVIPAVRLKLVELQRQLAQETDVVMDGRDIGTYVLPGAQLKIFLTASPEARAQRRYAELLEKGVKTTLQEVLDDMQFRDRNDSSREFAPLRPAEDSVLVDSTELNLQETASRVLELARERFGIPEA